MKSSIFLNLAAAFAGLGGLQPVSAQPSDTGGEGMLQKRGSGKCDKGWCWKYCGDGIFTGDDDWCWLAETAGTGDWVDCKKDSDCDGGLANCALGDCKSCGCGR